MENILKIIREQKGWTMYRAAKEAGMKQDTIKKLESGKGDAQKLYQYLKALNLKIC